MSGTPVPKGSSITPRDLSLLDHAGILGDYCVFCGAPRTDAHHEPPKGRIPKSEHHRIPRFACDGPGNAAGCHGMLHRNGGTITIQPPSKAGAWYAIADDKAAKPLNAMRKRHGLKPVKAHTPFLLGLDISSGIEITESPQVATATASPRDEVATAVAPLADEPATASGIVKVTPQPTSCANPNDASAVVRDTASPADLGSRLDALRKEAETNVALRNQLDYIIGGILREAREVYAQTVPGKRSAAQEYQSWVVDTLHMSKASVSRYEQYAALEDDSAADLGISLGYEVARVVKDGLDSKEGAIANAKAMSVRDFKSHYRPESDPMERVLICPDCGVVHPAALFKQGGTE